MSDNVVDRAMEYWRTICHLATVHLFGVSWPSADQKIRDAATGHWGCNPGIAWIVGHLGANLATPSPVILGTGHAAAFVFAHEVVRNRTCQDAINVQIAAYGSPGGDASEPLRLPGLPFWGGELGPALAVSQGMAQADSKAPVICIVGDGECETPLALAAFAHADIVLGPEARWLPIVNVNGARMGGPARYDVARLTSVLEGLGYTVVKSNQDAALASESAKKALDYCQEGRRVVWLSVTDKGWPAPVMVDANHYRGSIAHKVLPGLRHSTEVTQEAARWIVGFDGALTRGSFSPAIVALAANMRLCLPDLAEPGGLVKEGSRNQSVVSQSSCMTWARPIDGVDTELEAAGVSVFSPDEASSNGLARCMASGLVTEVLAEAVCASWAWGSVQAGRRAAFVTYEAFAPLASTIFTQYIKLAAVAPPRGAPSLLIICTSPSWANAPTHQNTDFVGIFLARVSPQVRVIFPYGQSSAASKTREVGEASSDATLAIITCSKQLVLDPPDLGGPATIFRSPVCSSIDGVLVAIGDVCITEAIAATTLAAARGIGIMIIAVAEPARLRDDEVEEVYRQCGVAASVPVVGVSMCLPSYVSPLLWAAWGRLFPIVGFMERAGATPWETLCNNGMDRFSLLHALAAAGVANLDHASSDNAEPWEYANGRGQSNDLFRPRPVNNYVVSAMAWPNATVGLPTSSVGPMDDAVM